MTRQLLFAESGTSFDVSSVLGRIAGEPLSYIAFLALVGVWGLRWYFSFTVRRLTEFKSVAGVLPQKNRLTALQLLILGFPETLTEQRMTLLKWRYSFSAFVITLLALLVVAGLIANAVSKNAKASENHLAAVKHFDKKLDESTELQQKQSESSNALLKLISENTEKLAFGLDEARKRNDEISVSLATSNSERDELTLERDALTQMAQDLAERLKKYESLGGPPSFVLKEAERTLANAREVVFRSGKPVPITVRLMSAGKYELCRVLQKPLDGEWEKFELAPGRSFALAHAGGRIYVFSVTASDNPENQGVVRLSLPIGKEVVIR